MSVNAFLGPRRIRRLGFEPLEARRMLSVLAPGPLARAGKTRTFYGTAGADTFEFVAGNTLCVRINGAAYFLDSHEVGGVVFEGRGGDDTAVLHGTAANEGATLSPASTSLAGPNYVVEVRDTTSITVRGGGGDDLAMFFDSPGDDTYTAWPGAASLEGEGFSLRAYAVDTTFACARAGGADVAELHGSPGDDTFVGKPIHAKLAGEGFSNRVKHFPEVHAYAGPGGNDVAHLFDSGGNDTLVAGPAEATLSGLEFSNRAIGFNEVYGYATSGGFDTAELHDSTGDDTFTAGPLEAGLEGMIDDAIRYEPGLDPSLGVNLVAWQNAGPDGATIWENAVQDAYDHGFRHVSFIVYRHVNKLTGLLSLAGPDDAHVAAGMARARALGMQITLNPFVEPSDGSSRTELAFAGAARGTFFTEYANYMAAMARMAETCGAARIMVGSELKLLVGDPANNAAWTSVIDAVDTAFTGQLGYAANWDNYRNENLTTVIWDNPKIDFMAVDAYFPLATQEQADASAAHPDEPFIASVRDRWGVILDDPASGVLPFAAERKGGAGMTVVLTEHGLAPQNRGTVEPWNPDASQPPDPDEQTNGYDALLRATNHRGDRLSEIYVWHWGMPGAQGSRWYTNPHGADDPGTAFDESLGNRAGGLLSEYVSARNTRLVLSVKRFDAVSVLATAGGHDVAKLVDSPRDDTFVATPTEAGLSGPGYSNQAVGFDLAFGVARGGGYDLAKLYDSPGDDTFVGRPTYGKLRGDGFENIAKLFDAVVAIARNGGNDVAYLFDSPGDDTFVGRPTLGRLRGDGFDNQARLFDVVYASGAAGGHDSAFFFDSERADTLRAAGRQVRLSDAAVDFFHQARAFESVMARASTAGDGAAVTEPLDFTLDLRGPWQDTEVASPFPFGMAAGRFVRAGTLVFLNVINYQPLEPGQEITGQIRQSRIADDLSRWQQYQGGSDPVVLRVYAQPTCQFPVRMPKSFYDGVRQLGFWIIRDVYFEAFGDDADTIRRGKAAVDAVIDEVEAAGALDRVFAWEIGNEFNANTQQEIDALSCFLAAMRDHIKLRMAEPHRAGASDWVTWGMFPPNDLLRTDGNPIPVDFDFFSINAYSYDPERIRDHQAGPVTGTPFAGYVAALIDAIHARFGDKPVVISETGLPDSPEPVPEQARLHPWYPAYRKGGLNGLQVAEGLADRIMDVRLPGSAAGMAIFEWNDEWHKAGDPNAQNHPEEYFGLTRFEPVPGDEGFQLREKIQEDAVRRLFTLDFEPETPVVTGAVPDDPSIAVGESTTLRATVDPAAPGPVHFRWESSRGRIVGDSATVQFFAGEVALGPAQVTCLAIDAEGRASTASVVVDVQPPLDPNNPGQPAGPALELLTLGTGRASGRVANVDMDQHKVVVYVEVAGWRYVQPYTDVPLIFVGPDGYWWTKVHNNSGGELIAWVVPRDFAPVDRSTAAGPPAGAVAEARLAAINDTDNDLLPDAAFELAYFGNLGQDRYGDPDGDLAQNIEELLVGGHPNLADNDTDADTLADNWERLVFRTLVFAAGDDPDGDGLTNAQELGLGIHPGRTAPVSIAEYVAGTGMNFLRAIVHPSSGLPYNEAAQSELDSGTGRFAGDTFVPAQLGNWLSAAVLSNALRRQSDGRFAAGYADPELVGQLEQTVASLEAMLASPTLVYTDGATGGKALYQAHDTATGQPAAGAWERIVSLLDNVQLIVGLRVTANYLRTLTPELDEPLAGRAGDLADRIEAALAQFDVEMWRDGDVLRLGGTNDPRAGSAVDRITGEGRLAPVVALARGEILPADFEALVDSLIRQSRSQTTPGGVGVQWVPFFGTALETAAVTPYLPVELDTFFGSNTLLPLADAIRQTSDGLSLPAAGATGVADGFGGFYKFGLSPAEGDTDYYKNVHVLIPPAAGMMAGALGTATAMGNLADTVVALDGQGLFDPVYGVPNYQDFGTGLVNMADPVRGTLEMAQMTVGLLYQALGGRFLEGLLRQTPAWGAALDQYAAVLNVREAEFAPLGTGSEISRGNASGDKVWHLAAAGDEVRYEIVVGAAGDYDLMLRYSNDDAGSGDTINVLVDGVPVDSFHTTDTGDWNVFAESARIPLGSLAAGPAEITLRMDGTDGFGVDLDRWELVR